MSWRDLVATSSNDQTLNRAKSVLGRKTVYKLGKGGLDPAKPFTSTCDCSGFVAWAIGIPRELPPKSGKWLSTDEYWKGGAPALPNLCNEIAAKDVQPGDLVVYPDYKTNGVPHQGHMAIITDVVEDKPGESQIIHCSVSNSNKGDAVQITAATVFAKNKATKIMRIDYDLLREVFPV